jgi:hypothetical protein
MTTPFVVWGGDVPAALRLPERPVFRPDRPARPGKVRCRSCGSWFDLGDDPARRLAELWSVWADEWLEKVGGKPTDPRPDVPPSPNKAACRCGAWTELSPDPQSRLDQLWDEWVADEQERLDASWRTSREYQIALQLAGQDALQREAEQQERLVREMRREAHKERHVAGLVHSGVPMLDAVRMAEATFPDVA